jgi:Spy/CpxP family protein refolding chaperone
MNFFSKNRFVFWLLVFLVVINLTALVTFFLFYSGRPDNIGKIGADRTCMTFRKELSLSPSQTSSVEAILADYHSVTDPLSEEIKAYRAQLLDELAKDAPDTSLIINYSEKISLIQQDLQKASVKQYLDLKKICTPEQCRKLSSLYFELYGCKGCGMGQGKGKGMMHRYGRGQGGCCDSGKMK